MSKSNTRHIAEAFVYCMLLMALLGGCWVREHYLFKREELKRSEVHSE